MDDDRPVYLDDPEYKAFLRCILANPHDDQSRLILADWLQDYDRDPERAEFIRVQCELVATPAIPTEHFQHLKGRERELFNRNIYRWELGINPIVAACRLGGDPESSHEQIAVITRGFVSEVRLTLVAFRGSRCGTCGAIPGQMTDGAGGNRRQCSRCDGSGFSFDPAKALFESHPITQVVITDPVIWPSGGNDTYYLGGLGSFPQKYWRRLEDLPSRMAVQDALSAVCLDLGRSLANLDKIPECYCHSCEPGFKCLPCNDAARRADRVPATLSDGTPVSIPVGEAPSF